MLFFKRKMMKDLVFHQQLQQQQQQEENMSNLTSASGDQASVSSGNHQKYFAPPAQAQPAKKKRNLPGNPDPDAEVVALSPKTLLATNRFVCEICNKGFQRDQNLQLHKRGHNLPWKLKQRTSKEVKKKVYVCPEPSCVHHDPSRALGDLTGIKKHYYRKHGEKKWKCDKCSKRYAVQSDWKAHSKTCGTREYRCDCGTLFSRRDSFITHRAFCDALAEESVRAITGAPNPLLSTPLPGGSSSINLQLSHHQYPTPQDHHHAFSLKKEQEQSFTNILSPELPPWLACPPGVVLGPGPGPPQPNTNFTSPTSSSSRLSQEFTQTHHQNFHHHLGQNPNPTSSLGTSNLPPYPSSAPSPNMSATALLQKAAQMGSTISTKSNISTPSLIKPHQTHRQEQQAHPPADSCGSTFGLAAFGHNSTCNMKGVSGSNAASVSLLQDMMNSFSSASGFEETSFEDAFVSGVLKKDGSFGDSLSNQGMGGISGNGGGGNEGLTRDFLGLRPLSQRDILNMAAGLGSCVNTSSSEPKNKSQNPW